MEIKSQVGLSIDSWNTPSVHVREKEISYDVFKLAKQGSKVTGFQETAKNDGFEVASVALDSVIVTVTLVASLNDVMQLKMSLKQVN